MKKGNSEGCAKDETEEGVESRRGNRRKMFAGRGLTEKSRMAKKMRDQRYWQNERSIQRAFFKTREEVSAKDLAENAQVSRSTLYRHHRNIYTIMTDIEQETIRRFEAKVAETQETKTVDVRWLFYVLLSFILKNQREFKEIVRRGDERVLEAMVDELMPNITKIYHIPVNHEESLRIYQKEIVAVLETWILDNFEMEEMRVLRDIMYLTRSARKHLLMIRH